jgi:hypothetical protein
MTTFSFHGSLLVPRATVYTARANVYEAVDIRTATEQVILSEVWKIHRPDRLPEYPGRRVEQT